MQHVAIFGCPRSGTSWLGQIYNAHPQVLYRYQPLFSYEFKDWFGHHGVSDASLAAFHNALRNARSDFVLQALRHPKLGPPSHLVWKEVRYHELMSQLLARSGLDHLVYLVREPVATINSWYLAPKEFRAGQDIRAEFRNAPTKNGSDPGEYNGLERWKASVAMALELQQRDPSRVKIVSYEALCADAPGQVAALYKRTGLALDDAAAHQVGAFLERSAREHEDDAYSVLRARRAAIELPPDVVAAIEADRDAAALLAAAQRAALRSCASSIPCTHEAAA